jgi:hypothetical protein
MNWECELTIRQSTCKGCGNKIVKDDPRIHLTWWFPNDTYPSRIVLCEECALKLLKARLKDFKNKLKDIRKTKKKNMILGDVDYIYNNIYNLYR